jgi:hypothetical protein
MNCYYCDQILPLSAYQVEGDWVWACSGCLLDLQGVDIFFGLPSFIPHSNSHFYRSVEKFEPDLSLF